MKTYVRIEDGIVVESTQLDNSIDITQLYHPDFQWIDITEITPQPEQRWNTSDGGKTFSAPPAPSGPTLEQVKASASKQLLANMNAFIATEPDGSVRYDQNFINTSLQYAIAHGMAQDPLPALNAWRQAIGAFYFETHAAIAAAATIAEVQAIDISVAGFEAKFGVSGTVSADPNITTQQLMS